MNHLNRATDRPDQTVTKPTEMARASTKRFGTTIEDMFGIVHGCKWALGIKEAHRKNPRLLRSPQTRRAHPLQDAEVVRAFQVCVALVIVAPYGGE